MGFSPRLAPHMAKLLPNPIFRSLSGLNEPGLINFGPGSPATDTFPYEDISKIAEELLETKPGELLQYGSPEGYPSARRAIAKMLSRYGLSPKPEEIILTTGSQQSIDLLCKLFIEPGDVALVESPTYSAALQILKSYRSQVITLESDEYGVIPEDLDQKIDIFTPKLAYLIPTFRNPSGNTISAERRAAIAEITGRNGVLLIEDDPYRDLRYRGERLPTIKSFDRMGNVVFLTTLSKILCPGLRVGAAYAPEGLIPLLAVAKQAVDMHSATLPQAIMGDYISRGLLDPHIESLCANYADRLGIMRSAIKSCFPESVITNEPQGGPFIWCVCPEKANASDIYARAMESKVAVVPGAQMFADGRGGNTFRLSFSCAPMDGIEQGVVILGDILKAYA